MLIRSSEYDKLQLKHQIFTSLYDILLKKKCHGVKKNAKICANGETECLKSLS